MMTIERFVICGIASVVWGVFFFLVLVSYGSWRTMVLLGVKGFEFDVKGFELDHIINSSGR